ncbi:outer membrane beta-barrel protein [Aeromonas simiae]|uniref:Porin family protein n=1 Tax=Aeromonas simiae TaxID=218936 RepID=A0A5J6WZF5_9GAMM|nr:outer membrane beta-barrel protein [Aeromonas simiae]QFI55467.1 porin family protein [Aeromonas simiae]
MKKLTVSLIALSALTATSAMAGDAFSYAKGAATWSHTKSGYLQDRGSDQDSHGKRDFGGVTLDLSHSFANNVYGRVGTEYTSRSSGNDSLFLYGAGVGAFTPLSTGFNLYAEAGLMGYSLERELADDVNGWDVIARKRSGSLYAETGLRYEVGDLELSTAYRYAKMTKDMNDFKVGAAYKLAPNWALTADYTYRHWDLQQGSITSLGVKYSF